MKKVFFFTSDVSFCFVWTVSCYFVKRYRRRMLPPRTPYVNISMLRLGAKDPNKNPTEAIILPAIVTGRQPNLFTRPLAMGPTKNNNIFYLYDIPF